MNTKNSPTTSSHTAKKYSGLLMLVASFLALIFVLAIITYLATQRFEQIANTQKVVLQQSVIVQELTKNLLNINLYGSAQLATPSTPTTPATATPSTPTASTTNGNTAIVVANDPNQIPLDKLPQVALYRIADIEKQTASFNTTLAGLKQGGEVTLLDGTKVILPATTDPKILSHLNNIEQVWTPYQGLLTSFSNNIKQGTLDYQISDYLVQYTRLYNQPLQAELNSINDQLNATTSQNANILRVVQLAGIIASILIFTLIVFRAIRRLINTDNQLEFARRQTNDIMKTVNEGLFLIDKELVISSQYSGKLEEILNEKDIAGKNLYDLLFGMISEKDMNTTKLFVEQLYNPWVVEELIQDLNPLKQVRLSYNDDKGVAISKFLEFNFLRVMDANQENIDSVFVSVIDITKEIDLQNQMQKDKEQHHHQIEMISYLLSVDSKQIVRFIDDTQNRLERMNNTLKDTDNHNLKDKAEQLYRETHSLKGDASALKLSALVTLAHKQEDHLKQLMGQLSLKGDDFLPFTIGLNEMMEMTSFIKDLLARLHLNESSRNTPSVSQLIHQDTNLAKHGDDSYWKDYFTTYSQDIAKRQNKQVSLDVVGFDGLDVDEKTMSKYKDIATQLLKNAIVHGIESPSDRLAIGKDQTGLVSLSLTKHNDGYQLHIKDDGKGIDWQQLRQKAVELGIYNQAQAKELTAKELVALMFKSGISTATAQDEDAGRGVGTDIIKQLTQELGGKMKIQSQTNQFTQINIKFPNRG